MTWMTSIARYRAIDMLRRANAGIKVSAGDADAVDTQHAPGAGPVELAVQQADNTRLTACLDELDPPRRTCLVIAYCDGYTHDELSVKLGSPVGPSRAGSGGACWHSRPVLVVVMTEALTPSQREQAAEYARHAAGCAAPPLSGRWRITPTSTPKWSPGRRA